MGKKQLYDVEFRNGVTVKSCGDHLWEVKNKFNVDPNSKFGKAAKQSTLSSVYNNNLNFAKNYVGKQNNFIKNNNRNT